MKRVFVRAAALTVAATMVFGAGACGSKTGTGTGAPAAAATSSKPADPKETLLASLAGYDKGVYAVQFTALDGSGQGAMDTPKRQAYIKVVSTDPEASFSMELLAVEPDSFVKMDMGELASLPGMQQLNGKTWMHLDRSKVKSDQLSLKADDVDPLSIKALLQSAQGVQQAGDRKLSGTLDLTKGADAPMTDQDVIKALAGKATAVPFTATLDTEGRLADLLIDVPAAGDKKAHQLKLAVTQYGSATVPAKPTGKDVVETPASMYEILNG